MTRRSLDLQQHVFPVFLAVASIGLAGASCGKKSSANPDEGESKAVVAAIDKATQEKESQEPKKAIEGVDTSNLDKDGQKLFDKVVGTLVSPCGKAESLRRSATVTKDCKRSVFAARYVAMMIEIGANEDQVREFYGERYVDNATREIAVDSDGPRSGAATAPIVIVEFLDYGCPSCKQAKKAVDTLVKARPADVVVYYKQYPLTHAHPDSKLAAQAVLAAHQQGKFKEMHDMLFAKQGAHKREQLLAYASQIGLDVGKFTADMTAAAAAVEADMKQGEELEVGGTPSFFVNGRRFADPTYDSRFLENWVEEELAVNR